MTDVDRFVLETFDDGGLLLDLREGTFFRLNVAATFVWQRTLAGEDPDGVATALGRTYHLDRSTAERDCARALDLPLSGSTPPSDDELHYAKVGAVYQFSLRRQALFEVTTDGASLRALRSFDAGELLSYLRAISAKVLALRGTSVLHAGAVITPEGTLTAFVGVSGAGKTTSARAFAHAGCKLISEDKLVLAGDAPVAAAIVDGESRIAAWGRETRARIEANPSAWHDTRTLVEIADGQKERLDHVWVVDSSRRRDTELTLRRLGHAEAAGALFHHGFYGSADAKDLRMHLKRAADLARRLPVDEATVPAGLTALEDAVRRYTENTAS